MHALPRGAPVLGRIAEERNLKLVKVNYDEERDLADRYGVQSIPTIILFENGAPTAQTIGAQPKNALERALALAAYGTEGSMSDAREIRRARAADLDTLIALWERSVRATHDFLTEADIGALRPLVREALSNDGLELWVLTASADVPIGFMGLAGQDIAALFLEPAHRGQGDGRRLVAHAQQLRNGQLTVDVNEQNPAARGFYEALGFVAIGRSPLDDAGRPFPILHMRRPTATDPSTRQAD